jgi:glucose-6-phosphate 1-epimerase
MEIGIRTPVGSARATSLGAQVVAASLGDRRVLWLTPQPTVPLRGGVPVCFPWFGAAGTPSHGFGRRVEWSVDAVATDSVMFELAESPETLAIWPHRFHAALTVRIGQTLDFEFAVTNTDTSPFTFTYALHSYFATDNLAEWRLDGLGAPVTAAEPIDQIWEQAPDRLTFDGLYVETSGMPSAVVWNPGPNEVGDIGSAYRDFVCVERGCIGSAAVTLEPAAQYVGSMRIGRQ